MSESLQIVFFIIVITLVLLLMAGAIAGLMVVNSNRRVKHRLELEAEQRRLQEELVRAEREATQQAMQHMGRELHDNVGQLLTAARVGLKTAQEEKEPRFIHAAGEALDRSIEEVRNLAHSLSPDLWQKRTLADALAAEAARLQRVVRMTASVRIEGAAREVAPDTSTILYRVFQETVNNTLKHSQASTIRITMGYGPPLTLSVSDKGKGFDPASTQGNGGFRTIQHRCELIGFSAQCISAPDRGCTWTFTERSATARAGLARS